VAKKIKTNTAERDCHRDESLQIAMLLQELFSYNSSACWVGLEETVLINCPWWWNPNNTMFNCEKTDLLLW